MAILDTEIQSQLSQYRTNAQVPIGGVPPASCSATLVPGKQKALLLATSGNTGGPNAYPAVMWNPLTPRPVLANTGKLTLSYNFAVNDPLNGMNCFETDTKLVLTCADGLKRIFNLSLQRHAVTGQLDIANWTDTGLRAGPITPDVVHGVSIAYSFDLVKNICSVLSYTCDGVVETVTTPTNMPAVLSSWTLGAYPQIQLSSLPTGMPWAVVVWGMQLQWS